MALAAIIVGTVMQYTMKDANGNLFRRPALVTTTHSQSCVNCYVFGETLDGAEFTNGAALKTSLTVSAYPSPGCVNLPLNDAGEQAYLNQQLTVQVQNLISDKFALNRIIDQKELDNQNLQKQMGELQRQQATPDPVPAPLPDPAPAPEPTPEPVTPAVDPAPVPPVTEEPTAG